MQTVVQVVCKKGGSLRDAIAKDNRIDQYDLTILREKKPGRRPGWTKVRSTAEGRRGSLNIQWSGSTGVLTCRVVNRGSGKPSLVIGDFIEYLLDRHRRRIRTINLFPAS